MFVPPVAVLVLTDGRRVDVPALDVGLDGAGNVITFAEDLGLPVYLNGEPLEV